MRYSQIGFALVLACGCDTKNASADAAPTSVAALSAAPLAASAAPSTSAMPLASGPSAPAPTAAPAQADASHLVLSGKVIQGGLVVAKIDGKVARIDFPGHRATVSDEGDLPIAFFRTAPPTEKMVIHFKDGSVLEHVFTVEQRTYAEEKINGLPEDEVKLDPKAAKANNSAEARIEAVRMKATDKTCWKDGFHWPVVGKITSHYGLTRVLNGVDGGVHWGVDIAVPTGTAIKAPACGTIVFAETGDPLSGTTLVLDHGHGVTSTFLHLSGFSKKVGDEVKQGDVVAKSGDTGRATGAHLDWRMNYFEVRVDPEMIAPPMAAK
jgi:murein DD-endopeptidase MepM/ murein hydrolase activator NlpD